MCPRFQTEMIMLHWKKEKWLIRLMWQNSTQLNSERLILESEYLLTFKAVSFIGPQKRTIFELPDTKVYWLSADLISYWINRYTFYHAFSSQLWRVCPSRFRDANETSKLTEGEKRWCVLSSYPAQCNRSHNGKYVRIRVRLYWTNKVKVTSLTDRLTENPI